MKKYSFKNLLVCLYICTVIYLFWGYFTNGPLKSYGFYKFLDNYFGRTIFIIAIIFFINLIGNSIECRKKRAVFKVRLFFFEILIVSIGILYFAKHIGITFTKTFATVEQLRYLTEIGLYKYKIGLFFIFLLDWIFAKSFGMYMYIVIYFLIFISAFFLFAKIIRVTITKIILDIKEKRRLKKERELIKEQLRLKAYYEKLEREREIARQKQLELEEQIRLERLMMEQIGQDDIETDEENDICVQEEVNDESKDNLVEIEDEDGATDIDVEQTQSCVEINEIEKVDHIEVSEESLDDNDKELSSVQENIELPDSLEQQEDKILESEENMQVDASAQEEVVVDSEEINSEEKSDIDTKQKLETQEELKVIKKLAHEREEQSDDTSL